MYFSTTSHPCPTSVIARMRPQVTRAPLLKMRKSIPQKLTTTLLYPLRYPAYRIFWRVLDEKVNVIHIRRHINDFNIQFLTRFTDDFAFSERVEKNIIGSHFKIIIPIGVYVCSFCGGLVVEERV